MSRSWTGLHGVPLRVALSLMLLLWLPLDATGQSRPLTDFRYMLLHPPQNEERGDRFELVQYFKERLGPQGWDFPPLGQLPSSNAEMSQTLVCTIAHTDEAASSSSVELTCTDYVGRAIVRLSGSGGGWTHKGALAAAIRQIAAELQEMRPGFVESSAVDAFEMFPNLEQHPLTESGLDQRIAAEPSATGSRN